MDIREDLKYYGKLVYRELGYIAGQLELTSACFQRCFACDSWKQHVNGNCAAELTYDIVAKFCKSLNDMPMFENLSFTGGDPQAWQYLELLLSVDRPRLNYSVQINTALMKEPGDPWLWQTAVDSLRISLDAITPAVYEKMRGVQVDPKEIIARLERLHHKSWVTITCVTPLNIKEMPLIVEALAGMKSRPRKAIFLPVLGMDSLKDSKFWEEYEYLSSIITRRSTIPTSFAENPKRVWEFINSKEAETLPCFAGAVSFHIKCNGDVYPCCLVGGEAIKTQTEMAVGNIYRSSIAEIQRRYRAQCHYRSPDSPCRSVCQYKQLQMNLLGREAGKQKLTMP